MQEKTRKPARRSRDTGTFAALRIPDFRLLLVATTLSNAGHWIQQVTLGWLVYDLTNSGTMLGSINLVRSISTLGLAPVAGVAIDRFSHRLLMLLTSGWIFLISLTLGLALQTGRAEIWWLFAFSLLGGAAQAVDQPLRQTVVFSLVPRALAPNAVALVQTGWALMRSLGPAFGGVLILWIGAGGNFLVQAGTYALIALTVMRLRFPPRASGSHASSGRNLGEGIRYILRNRDTRAFVLIGWTLPLLIIPNYAALPPIYAKDVFGGGPGILGLILSSVGIGGIVGGIVAASLGNFERRGLVQMVSLGLTGLSLIGFALSSNLWVALVMFGMSGFWEMIFLTNNQTLLQLSIPDEVRGRVMGIVTLNSGLSPIGGVIAGIGADFYGPAAMTLVFCGVAVAIAIGVLIGSPMIRDYRLSQAIERSASASASHK